MGRQSRFTESFGSSKNRALSARFFCGRSVVARGHRRSAIERAAKKRCTKVQLRSNEALVTFELSPTTETAMQVSASLNRTSDLAEAAWAFANSNHMTCRRCGEGLRIYSAPVPDLFMFGDDEGKRNSFLASRGPLAICDQCNTSMDVISVLRL
ncbi:hypothetical protein QTI66_15585 [Variovorax sp. J22R133]|uniref:hypothetical protein n=1 Tax=Variovorax brevis TaxID=3053503 RepID=UPI00257727E3|nr:hypothetical protein [Variovorax sp. J22R133]MDM0113581.1 hypothetical protein [Variovorax sp. J22R133]